MERTVKKFKKEMVQGERKGRQGDKEHEGISEKELTVKRQKKD
jgi:hypothetical protein